MKRLAIILYRPLTYDVERPKVASEWNEKFPPSVFPVLSFTGAPASFPVRQEHAALHRHLVWNEEVSARAKDFIEREIGPDGFVGVHLRNGADWDRACELVGEAGNLFASPQCLGRRNELGALTLEMCPPPEAVVVTQLRAELAKLKLK